MRMILNSHKAHTFFMALRWEDPWKKKDGFTDRISSLPDPILARILFFLPPKEAAITSVLSKTWNRIWVSSVPIFQFDLQMDEQFPSFASHHDEPLDDQKQRLDKFMNFVNTSLEKLWHQKSIIEKIKLCITRFHPKFSYTFSRWVGLVAKHCIVKELALKISFPADSTGDLYPTDLHAVPPSAFQIQSLSALRLHGLKLESENFYVKFSHLKELSLIHVYIRGEHILEDLFLGCSFIEKFIFLRCRGVDRLRLAGLPRLKEVRARGSSS
ncbi:F-box/FBD/LRR-repeat protein At5g56420-like [Malania oleifera]|uniref:F-box/FBD/LRR-repeat protein At5g56420-like n=1 Tax=Malania oleifera TaxID=397392 RepID=UPI0025AE0E0F|nr:F-box/FBD/LRR-repeat protein At5g56420-like [Malania oleifera]